MTFRPESAPGEESARLVTAVHEAGHVWAYKRLELPIRYVTVRPRRADAVGLCALWKPRRMDVSSLGFIASLGPIAEAVFTMATDSDGYEFEDHLFGAILSGGHDDLERSCGFLDCGPFIDGIRDLLVTDWHGIRTLADQLVRVGTVSGRDAFELLEAV